MKKRIAFPLVSLFLIVLFLFIACMPVQPSEPAPVQVEAIGDLELLIEGRIVPQQWVELSFAASGLVEEIYFDVDDAVSSGDIIARLNGAEQLSASLAAAELELLLAQQAYDALQENHDLVKAQALAERITLEQAIELAETGLEDLKETDLTEEIEQARANLVLLEDQLEKAKNRYEDYEDYSDSSLTKAQTRINLANARKALDEGNLLIETLETRNLDLEIEKAEAELALLEEQLVQAQDREAELENGPSEEEIALAQQRLDTAQAGVDSARAALESLVLAAPFDGVIVESALKKGQLTLSGQRSVVLADTSQWLVETDDLTEIDRVGIRVGQAVTVIPDAIPDLEIAGEVLRISDFYQENRGDITYKTIISLEPADADLYWGMTVLINFEED
jgi:HlyD family secretion protein